MFFFWPVLSPSGRFWMWQWPVLEKRLKLWMGDACRKGADMNEYLSDLDQADEEILTYTVSDEALEAAAGTEGAAQTVPGHVCTWTTVVPD
jgi:hypothetical protein